MKTYLPIIRQIITLFIISFFILTLSCSDDPSSPKKEDEDPLPEETVTIGVEGGTVEKGDLKLTIPAGAFDEDYNISVSEVEDDGAFGDNAVTPSYKISGIPGDYSKPLKLVAKYSGDLSGKSYLGIGQKSLDIIEESSSIVFNMYEASDSIGYLVSSIPASISPKNLYKKNEITNFDFFPVFATGYAITNSIHFKFVFPITAIQQIVNLEEMFEDAYSVVEDGLQVLINEEIYRLVIVKQNNKPMTTNFESKTLNGENQLFNIFNINQNSLTNEEYYSLQVKATQELFSFTGWPETNNYISEKKIFEGHSWIEFAIYCWIEDLVNGDPNYKYPKNFFWEGMESFNGFNQKLNDDENPVPHGRGMSALIKYLTNRDPLKIAFIGKFIKNNKAPGTLVKDFVESIDLPSNDWWPGYLKELVNNELFELPDDYFISRAHAEWDINSAEDISKILTHTYQDLSAKMFKINLNYPDLEDTQNLKFKMIGPENDKDLSLILFSINNNKPQYIETTKLAEYEIINPKSYFSNGTGEFLAVLVNSNLTQDDYLGQSEITLEISVSQKVKTILDYKNCFFSSSLMGRYENKWADGSLHYWDEPFGIGSFNFIPGEFTGNEFVGSLTFSGYLNVATAITELTITAVISENKDEIISFEFTKVTNFNNESNEIRTEKVIGANIPLYPDRDDLFRINGLDVCNDEIKYFYEDIFYSQDGGENYVKIIEVGCTDESKLELFFAE